VPADVETVWLQPEPPGGIRSQRVKLAVVAGLGLALVFVLGSVSLVRYWPKHDAGSGLASTTSEAATNGPFTKTLVLTRATNQWVGATNEVQTVGVWTDAAVGPGEAIQTLVKYPDRPLAEAQSSLFVQWQSGVASYSSSLSWFVGRNWSPGFGEDEAQAAANQLRENWCNKPLTLVAGEPLELFAVTNRSGSVMAGYLKYMRSVPKPPERSGALVVKPQAIVNVRRYSAVVSPSVFYSVKLPPGYALWATASQGQASTHYSQASKPDEYYTAWFRPHGIPGNYRDYPAQLEAQRKALEEQFQELLDRGRIPVVLGEPCQVFALTNKNGEVYRGFFELVAPTPDAAPTQVLSRHPGRTKPAFKPLPGKTVVLTRATNHWGGASKEVQDVGVWTDANVGPGEALLALQRHPDGSLTEAFTQLFVEWESGVVNYSTSLSWFVGGNWSPGFGEDAAQAATSQLRKNWSDKPLTLAVAEPLELFAITNHAGGVMAGYLKYMRSVPEPPERSGRTVVKPQAIVHVRRCEAFLPSITYAVELPSGYALWATASQGKVSTSITQPSRPGDYRSTWFRPPWHPGNYRDLPARMEAQHKILEEQFQELQDRGPIPVVLGEPCQVFAVTNKNGEVYRGSFELVGPAVPATR
jgi:hypothetical protein